ncbi:helix-turn-helix domain-containing protein [Runella salmonicolor]|uniref:Helix-turn-helix domain-containing protein n=1 Tax=Runella salmonicolor TaxID=2950278 RepID=A0ABT1FV04_9BACT|nr:helix-turn-helix domain-containing protein [Runella salmonicolor]MCP1384598.1 helix-turn-helix domain-containing protein [Runella salmonicolor]
MQITVISITDLAEIIKANVREALAEQAAPQSRQHAAHEYLNMAEASKYLQLPQNTLYVFCHERRIPYSKRGKRNYFLRADLDEWMASNRKQSVKEIEVAAMAQLRKGGKK